MAAALLTQDFNSNIKNVRSLNTYIAATGAVFYRGALVQLDASGNVAPATGGVTYKILGRAANSLVSTDAASSTVVVEEGDILLDLADSNTPAQANVGSTVYAVSDHEISTSSSTNAKAGLLIGLEGSKARVRCTQECT